MSRHGQSVEYRRDSCRNDGTNRKYVKYVSASLFMPLCPDHEFKCCVYGK